MYRIHFFIFIMLVSLTLNSVGNYIFAKAYHVSPSGSNLSGQGTIGSPWQTISFALDSIYPGDILYLREGVYYEQLVSIREGTVNAYIKISSYQNENASIDGTGVVSGNNGAIITHSFLKLIGITFQNWNDNGMEITNCEFIELIGLKVTSVTGGIHLTGTVHDFVVDSCIMYDYYGGDGGFGFDATPEGITDSIYNGVISNCKAYLTIPAFDNCDGFALGHDGVSNILFYNCEVYGVGDAFDISGRNIILERCSAHNSTFGGGYKLWRDNVTLINCIGYNNTSNVELDFDIDVNKGVNARLINCTFYGSSEYNIWIENSAGGSTLEMFNCIVAGGNNTGLTFEGDSISCYTGDYNLFHMNNPERMVATSEFDFTLTQVQNGEWTVFSGQDAHTQVVFNSSNLFMDTLVTNPDLHLIAGSLAIDNGTNLPGVPSFDFDGNPRPSGNGYDIGAYEYQTDPDDVGDKYFDFNNKEYQLFQNYPNPFNPDTKIRFQIPQESRVTIMLYNILGAEVTTILKEKKEPGVYEVKFTEQQLPSGTYIYRIITDNFIETKKMVLMK